jgi:hypothetical protein
MATKQQGLITKKSIMRVYDRFLSFIENPTTAYGKYIILALAIVIATAGGYMGYRWYVGHRNQAAQYTFGTILDSYLNIHDGTDADFLQVAQQAEEGFKKHKNSALAPLFITLQADALIQAYQAQAALDLMSGYLPYLDTTLRSAPLFKTKLALLNLACKDEASRSTGLEMLQAIAHDTTNVQRDYAQYQLFIYYWTHDALDDARAIGQELLTSQKDEMRAPSPWGSVVAEKLESLGA